MLKHFSIHIIALILMILLWLFIGVSFENEVIVEVSTLPISLYTIIGFIIYMGLVILSTMMEHIHVKDPKRLPLISFADLFVTKSIYFSIVLLLVYKNLIEGILFILVLVVCELIIFSLRYIAVAQGRIIQPNQISKIANLITLLTLGLLLLGNLPFELYSNFPMSFILLIISVVFTVVRTLYYFQNARFILTKYE